MNHPAPRSLPAAGLAVSIAAAIVLGSAACSRKPDVTEAPAPRTVRIATVRSGPAEPPVFASGQAASRDEAKLAFKVGGVIAEIAVREGDVVTAGQRLARIEVNEIDAQVTQASEALRKAERDLERGRKLFQDDVVTREQLDDLTTAAAVARAQSQAAGFNRRYAEIVAGSDGRVLRRLAEPKELIAAGTPVLIVSSAGSGTVLNVGLADRDALRVAIGDDAEVRFEALPDRVFTARVQQVARASDPRTGTWRCELAVDTAQAGLPAFSGLIGRARIVPKTSTATARSYLPIEALVEGDQAKARLYLFDPATQKVSGRDLAIAFVSGREVVLADALPEGTQVVTDGAAYLRDGDVVRVADAATRAERAP